ncbi:MULTISPECIES: hypothetical protein [unclassified Methanoregula]|uniref:hypothetical protein n=1 Tax=unclassified Methanoregula TaxID=2649730 RepID=UPI0009D2B028|nr:MULTISPECIES: hypothetical protein [unclassified Methanoregula]OPX61667.1 MAG: hypothetical protein A4E33_02767 [Methanoregula sp. PtaB.Bin085]OPY34024.1 MAG: hypothetical protein A4E34_01611 [Methanoregula sp. PtaU1.Bin006]
MGIAYRGILVSILVLAIAAAPAAATVYFTSSAPGIITKGDQFTITGTGAANGTIGIWIIGRDHFEILTTSPDRQGNFTMTIKPSATAEYSSGQYVILCQDPGTNGILEIEGGTDVNGNLVVMNRGKIVSRLGSRQELGGNIRMIADQIQSASSDSKVDDNIQAEFFFVAMPKIYFNDIIPASGLQLPDQVTGERIVITGTTNIGPENILNAEIWTVDPPEIVSEKNVPILAGESMNTWSWDIEAPGLPPGDYNLTVTWDKSVDAKISGTFTVKHPASPTTSLMKPVDTPLPPQDDLTFPVFVASTLIVLAIVLYYAGKD